jgi:uncharacterized protein (DUF433 family)
MGAVGVFTLGRCSGVIAAPQLLDVRSCNGRLPLQNVPGQASLGSFMGSSRSISATASRKIVTTPSGLSCGARTSPFDSNRVPPIASRSRAILEAMPTVEHIQPTSHIEMTAGVCGGRPRVRGTRVKVSEIARRHVEDDESADEITEALPQLTLAQVHAALAYYYDHREEIEEELRSQNEIVVRLAREYAPHLVSE